VRVISNRKKGANSLIHGPWFGIGRGGKSCLSELPCKRTTVGDGE